MKKVDPAAAVPQTVDDYLAALPEEARATLEKIRKALGRPHHQRLACTVPAHGRHHETFQAGSGG